MVNFTHEPTEGRQDSLLQHYHEERHRRESAYNKMASSSAYQSELKFIEGFTDDIILLIRICLIYSTRAGAFSAQSLVIRSMEDLGQSVLACWLLVQQGMINPVKREPRYIIESAIKYLFIDQQSVSLAERLALLEAGLDSSIGVRKQLHLAAFHPDDAKLFIDELNDAYRTCCAYIHVSPKQVKERFALGAAGRSLGFETDKELRKIGRLMFRIYDMALTLYLHGYGLPMTGDVFINALDDLPKWRFHKGKYVSLVSAYFDYKHERNIRKYGESRPWTPEGWPPKRL